MKQHFDPVHPVCQHRRTKLNLLLAAALALICTCPAPRAHANIYATNLRLNGGATNIPPSSTNYALSYILNEPASLGVTVEVTSGTNVIRSFVFPAGNAGAKQGTNTVVWD